MDGLTLVTFNDSISIVIPLYNKENNIETTIKNIVKYIKSPKLQIIIVENESTDSSNFIAKNCVKKYKNFVDIELYESKKGLGYALVEGFKHCSNDWIYFIPADFSFGNSEILYIDNNNLYSKFDIFVGSKSHKESIITRSKSRKIYSFIFNNLLKILFFIPFKDTQGSLIFKSKILQEIGTLENKEFMITTEFLIKAHISNKKIKEIPIIDLKVKTKSTVKPFLDGLKMLINIFILRFKISKKKK